MSDVAMRRYRLLNDVRGADSGCDESRIQTLDERVVLIDNATPPILRGAPDGGAATHVGAVLHGVDARVLTGHTCCVDAKTACVEAGRVKGSCRRLPGRKEHRPEPKSDDRSCFCWQYSASHTPNLRLKCDYEQRVD